VLRIEVYQTDAVGGVVFEAPSRVVNREVKLNLTYSYRCCREIAKERAKNFYYAFLVLPREKRDAMCAVYAFMRYCDDIADDPGIAWDKRKMLDKWRASLDEIKCGTCKTDGIMPAFRDTVCKFDIPLDYFYQLIDGAKLDLEVDRYENFDQLYDYCYKVASVVGLVCIHIFGFDSLLAKKHAEYCGVAFQLTNILRDLGEDSSMGRVYIPEEDFWAFGYSRDDLERQVIDDRFIRLMRFEVQRARCYYDAALPLIPLVHESGRAGLRAMIGIYSSILDKIEQNGYDVFSKRISLSTTEKLAIAAKSLFSSKLNGGRQYQPELQS
jgi:phytoene synthase